MKMEEHRRQQSIINNEIFQVFWGYHKQLLQSALKKIRFDLAFSRKNNFPESKISQICTWLAVSDFTQQWLFQGNKISQNKKWVYRPRVHVVCHMLLSKTRCWAKSIQCNGNSIKRNSLKSMCSDILQFKA